MLCGLFISSVAIAQNKAKRFALGINAGITEYAGDVDYGFFKFKDPKPTGGITLDYYMNRSFNGQLTLSSGTFSGETDGVPINSFETFFINFGLNIKYKFNNGYILKESSKIRPYVWTGINYIDYKAKNTSGLLNNPGEQLPDATKEAAFSLPLGIGVGYQFNPIWGIHLQTNWSKPASDELDNFNLPAPEGFDDANDRVLMHQIGISYTFGDKDSDGDGVVDKYDRCPKIPGNDLSFGCPDADDDGVLDADDKCPNVKGIVFGCPDSDGDGFIDAEDKCPDVAGSLYGCLDSDADGIADAEDNCPELKGCINGCPDMDGDGVIDPNDECPEVFGNPDNKGCPMLVDEQPIVVSDVVKPTEPNIEPNNNVEKRKEPISNYSSRLEQEIAHTSTTIYTVFFDYNSSVINPAIRKELDLVASVMVKNPEYYMVLEGHTDSKGSDKYNKWLSGRRVDKVMNYLVSQGVKRNKIEVIKYGESKPLLPNDSATGMEKNRRVVMKVVKN